MTPEPMLDAQRNRHRAWVVGVGIGFVLLLAVATWVGWRAAWRATQPVQAAGLAAADVPTRTPRPLAPSPTPIPVDLTIIQPPATLTPAPTATATPGAPALPPELAEIAQRYEMDVTRRFIVVDLDAQMMTTWDPSPDARLQGVTLRRMPVSTGDETRGYRTLKWYGLVGEYWGTFDTGGVYADEGWYLFEDAGSILIHSAPYRLVDGQKVYEELAALGAYPASKGCIRLAPADAAWFTRWQPQGVPIAILPKDGTP